MPPYRRADRTHARPARALLFPQFLTRTGDFPADLGLCRAGSLACTMMPHRFVNQRFIHFGAEDGVIQIDRPDYLIPEIENVNAWHGYLLLLPTRRRLLLGWLSRTISLPSVPER